MIKNNQNIPQRSCFGNNPLFEKGFMDGFHFHCRNTPEVLSVLSALLPNPDEAFNTGKILKQGTRTHGGIVSFSEKSYYLKRYNDMGFWYRLRHFFKRSRAVRTWRVGCAFHAEKIPIPEPVLCLEERPRFLLHRSYILMKLVKDAANLKAAWPNLSEEQKTRIVIRLAETLNKMHKSNYTHGDLKWDNIMVSCSGVDVSVTLVDIDSCSTARFFAKTRIQKDIKLFLRWLKHHEADKVLLKELMILWEESYSNKNGRSQVKLL